MAICSLDGAVKLARLHVVAADLKTTPKGEDNVNTSTCGGNGAARNNFTVEVR